MAGLCDQDAMAQEVQYACPHCRSAIELTEFGGHCPSCGFQVTRTSGIYSFLGMDTPIDDWQSTFDDLASGPDRDTSAGVG